MRNASEQAAVAKPLVAGGAVLLSVVALAYGPALAGWSARPPDWSLLADESVALKAHLTAAIGTLVVGVMLLTGVKGRAWHKRLGWAWVVLMAVTAVSSFWLQFIRPGSFSWIHGLSGWVVVVLPAAVYAARSKRIRLHRRAMTGLFVGGTLVAGFFALMPGRLLWRVLIG